MLCHSKLKTRFMEQFMRPQKKENGQYRFMIRGQPRWLITAIIRFQDADAHPDGKFLNALN